MRPKILVTISQGVQKHVRRSTDQLLAGLRQSIAAQVMVVTSSDVVLSRTCWWSTVTWTVLSTTLNPRNKGYWSMRYRRVSGPLPSTKCRRRGIFEGIITKCRGDRPCLDWMPGLAVRHVLRDAARGKNNSIFAYRIGAETMRRALSISKIVVWKNERCRL